MCLRFIIRRTSPTRRAALGFPAPSTRTLFRPPQPTTSSLSWKGSASARLRRFSVPLGTGVTITGFTGATAVSFNGVAAAFTVDASGTITTTVPAGATTGPITITTPGGPLVTTTRFTVTPAITSFAPGIGAAGTGVTITGTNFTGATAVSFNGHPAQFTVSNSGTVTTTVPVGAPNGPITVTTLDGTATSTGSFTVTPGGVPFSLSATPSSQTVTAGASTGYTVTISRNTGFTDNLTFSVTGLPAATTAIFSPNPTSGNSSHDDPDYHRPEPTGASAHAVASPGQLQRPCLAAVGHLPAGNGSACVSRQSQEAHSTLGLCHWRVRCAALHRLRRRRFYSATTATRPHGTPAGTFTLTVTATSSNASVQPVSMPVTLIVK